MLGVLGEQRPSFIDGCARSSFAHDHGKRTVRIIALHDLVECCCLPRSADLKFLA